MTHKTLKMGDILCSYRGNIFVVLCNNTKDFSLVTSFFYRYNNFPTILRRRNFDSQETLLSIDEQI